MRHTRQLSFGKLCQEWKLVPLPEYVFLQEGPGLRRWQWTNDGMKVINVTNILDDGSVDVNNTDRYVSLDEFKNKYDHFAVEDGDIVVASSGNTYGKMGRVNRSHLPLMMNTSVVRFHPLNRDQLHSGYLYAFLRSPLFMNQVEAFVIGSAQPNFGPSHLNRMLIPLPPFPVQRKIAAILSAYDDLIENNTRRIKILEEMAQAIYKEWFVNFRFPGHEEIKMVASELGLIPEGWEVKKLGDVIELAYGKALKAEDRSEGPFPVYGSGGIVGYHNRPLVDGPGIIVGRKGNVGSVYWSEEDFFPIDTVFYVNTSASMFYVYYNLRAQHFFNNDAAVPGLNRGQAYRNQFLMPSHGLVKVFEDLVKPFFRQLKMLALKNTNLRATRDLLLPKLTSGEVDVEGLEIDTEGLDDE
ncbi:MAG: restriction endonuclease subunit S [Chloroflexi bacterium]|nr:restriction endonuclease subunit S [Chloroflexota bacterium]